MESDLCPIPPAPNRQTQNSPLFVLIGLLTVAYLLTAKSLATQIGSFNLTHWLFSYQDGLYSRALVGSLMRVFLGEYRGMATVIAAVAGVVTALLVIAIVVVGFRYWLQHRSDSTLLYTVAFIASPGTIQFFARETGRLDQVGYLVVIGVCFVLLRTRGRMQWVIVAIVAMFLCLVHEAFVVMLVPALVAVVLVTRLRGAVHSPRLRDNWLSAALSVLPAMGLAAGLVTIGRLDYDTQLVEVVRRLSDAADFSVSPTATVVHFRTLGQNALYTVTYWVAPSRILSFLAALLALLPSGLVAFRLAWRVVRMSGKGLDDTHSRVFGYGIVLCCMAPLFLMMQGLDYPRWMASAITNLFLLGMVARLSTSANEPEDNSPYPLSNTMLCWIVIFSLAVGPVAVQAGPYSLLRLPEALRAVFGTVP